MREKDRGGGEGERENAETREIVENMGFRIGVSFSLVFFFKSVNK